MEGMTSYAALTSIKRSAVKRLIARDRCNSDERIPKLSAHDLFFLKPYWNGERILLFSTQCFSFDRVSLSKIFKKQEARAIGLNFLRVVLGRRNMRKFFQESGKSSLSKIAFNIWSRRFREGSGRWSITSKLTLSRPKEELGLTLHKADFNSYRVKGG